MSDLQAAFDNYKSQHGKNPNASQLARLAGVRYSAASSFIRNGGSSMSSSTMIKQKSTPSHTKTRSQTVTSSTSFSPVTKRRSFSKQIYSPPRQSSTGTGIDYSGSTTGANNPWKQFQKSKSTYNSGFSHSYSVKKEKPKPKPKPKPLITKSYTSNYISNSPRNTLNSPKQSVTKTVKTNNNTASATSKYNFNASPRALNYDSSPRTPKRINNSDINGLRNKLTELNNKYERQCNKIHSKFDTIRNDLNRKENDIINDLTDYNNQCKQIIEISINKMEKLMAGGSNSSINNGYKQLQNKAVEVVKVKAKDNSYEKKEVISNNNNVNRSTTGIDYSGATTGVNNPWKTKQQTTYSTSNNSSNVSGNKFVSSYSEPSKNDNNNSGNNYTSYGQTSNNSNNYTQSKPTSVTTTVKAFIPKLQRDVDSDEWSNSEGSWN